MKTSRLIILIFVVFACSKKQAEQQFPKINHTGQMSAWHVFTAMGFYPVNSTGGIYVIGSPLLEEVQLALENGKKFTMRANNLSDENIYIQSVSLNGSTWRNVWLDHKDIIKGATLEFEMGNKPS